MRGKVVFVDTETGGLDPLKHSLLSIGVAIVQDGAVVDTMYTLVKEPEIVAEASALKINGLDLDVVYRDGVTPLQAVNMLVSLLQKNGIYKNAQFAAHNAPFDKPFIKRMFELAGKKMDNVFSYRPLCTQTGALMLDLAGRITLPGGSASLDNLVKLWSIKLDREGGHNALQDAIAGAHVLVKELELMNGNVVGPVARS
jgi:DNA polymerase-3 subunit epsilon